MALIKCTECGHKVSDRAIECPECGCPVSEILLDIKENEMFDELENKKTEIYSELNRKFINEINGRSIENLEFLLTLKGQYSIKQIEFIRKTLENKKLMKCTPNVSEKFKKAISEYPLSDLKFMRDTQQALYSEEEMQYICKVINNRQTQEEQQGGYGFQYAISFLIPLVGFILGAIMLSKNDERERSGGKSCIVLSITSIILCTIFMCAKVGFI
ncbi:hypothetical protein FMM68_04045 [Lachnospiraceae bacterium MD329]|nr:hypothetical protein [Lachnospiraceae bacterium MD329]